MTNRDLMSCKGTVNERGSSYGTDHVWPLDTRRLPGRRRRVLLTGTTLDPNHKRTRKGGRWAVNVGT